MIAVRLHVVWLAVLAVSCSPAAAGLSRDALSEVRLAPEAGARLPLDLALHGPDGRAVTLKDALGGKPALVLPVDYGCRTICGPAISILGAALADSGLVAGADYRLVTFGLDPKDGGADALRFIERRIGEGDLAQATSALTGEAAALARLTEAIGYRYAYDAENGAYAHPAALIAVTADGRVTRALSSLAIAPRDLRLALTEAGEGSIGGVAGQLALLCYGFDAVHGIYTASITRLLQIGGALMTLAIAAMIALLSWRERRRGEA